MSTKIVTTFWAVLFAVASPAATVTWTVTNGGEGHAVVIPTNAKPQMDTVLAQAKTYLNANANDTLILFFPSNTFTFYHSNSSAILINNFTNGSLVLRGAGTNATALVFDQFDQQGIRISASQRITVEQMHLTRTGLYVTQGDVVSVQPGRVRFQVHPGFPDPVWLFNLGGAATQERTLIGYTHDDPLDPHFDPVYAKVLLSNLTNAIGGPTNQYDAILSDANEVPPWPVGEWVAQKCKTGDITVKILASDDCIVQDVRFTRSCGNGLRAINGVNRMLVQRVTLDRSDPINGRAPCFSSPAGGPQVYCGYAGATIRDCVIIGTADDGIGYFADDPSNMPTNGLIAGNLVRDNQARGIIIASSAGGICQSNVLVRNNEAGVLMINLSPDVENHTNAAVRDWTIANNAFIEAWVGPAIWLANQCTNAGLHDNIDIVSNSFIEAPKNNNLVYVRNANEIRINNNTITSFSDTNDYTETTGLSWNPSSATNTLVFVYSGAWVHGTNNTYLQSMFPTNRLVSQQTISTNVVNVAWSFLSTPKPKVASIGVTNIGGNAQQVVVQIANLQPGNICRFWKSTDLVTWHEQGAVFATNIQGANTWTEIVTNQLAAFFRASW